MSPDRARRHSLYIAAAGPKGGVQVLHPYHAQLLADAWRIPGYLRRIAQLEKAIEEIARKVGEYCTEPAI